MRIPYFDFLRCFAIMMVVFVHCFGFCYTYPDVIIPIVFIRNLMNVAVPIFFAVSGYLLATKQMENGGYALFLKKQIPRVYIPVLFCSLFFLFKDLSHGFSVNFFVKFFCCGYSVYYFIAVIIQCYVLLWFFKKNVSVLLLIILAILGFVWWGMVHSLFCVYMEKEVPLVLYAGNIIPWGIFFVEGLYIGLKKNMKIPVVILAVVGLSILLSIIESFFIMQYTLSLQGLGQKSSIFCFNVLFCAVVLQEKVKKFFSNFERYKIYQILCSIGRCSFGIYLVHFFILSKIVLLDDIISLPFIKWIVDSVVTFVFCFVLLFCLKKIAPKVSRILLGV